MQHSQSFLRFHHHYLPHKKASQSYLLVYRRLLLPTCKALQVECKMEAVRTKTAKQHCARTNVTRINFSGCLVDGKPKWIAKAQIVNLCAVGFWVSRQIKEWIVR